MRVFPDYNRYKHDFADRIESVLARASDNKVHHVAPVCEIFAICEFQSRGSSLHD